jgi:hypothetical protein
MIILGIGGILGDACAAILKSMTAVSPRSKNPN